MRSTRNRKADSNAQSSGGEKPQKQGLAEDYRAPISVNLGSKEAEVKEKIKIKFVHEKFEDAGSGWVPDRNRELGIPPLRRWSAGEEGDEGRRSQRSVLSHFGGSSRKRRLRRLKAVLCAKSTLVVDKLPRYLQS